MASGDSNVSARCWLALKISITESVCYVGFERCEGTASLSRLAKGGFDPFAELLTAQAARPAQLGLANLRTLTPFQRAGKH